MKEHKIPARSELDPQFTWATTDLYPSDEAWEAEIPKVKAMIDQFKAFQGKLGESARSLPQAEIAQLVEHFTRNEGVEGSSPFFGLEKDLVNILSVFIRSFAVTTPSGTVQ